MGIMVSSVVWVMQDLYHQPYVTTTRTAARPDCRRGEFPRAPGSFRRSALSRQVKGAPAQTLNNPF